MGARLFAQKCTRYSFTGMFEFSKTIYECNTISLINFVYKMIVLVIDMYMMNALVIELFIRY